MRACRRRRRNGPEREEGKAAAKVSKLGLLVKGPAGESTRAASRGFDLITPHSMTLARSAGTTEGSIIPQNARLNGEFEKKPVLADLPQKDLASIFLLKFPVEGVKWAFFDPPSFRVRFTWSILRIMLAPALLRIQKSSPGKAVILHVKMACC